MSNNSEGCPDQLEAVSGWFEYFEIASGAVVAAGAGTAVGLIAEADHYGVDLYVPPAFLVLCGLAAIVDGVKRWRAERQALATESAVPRPVSFVENEKTI
jgi:hypothetical protein